MGKFIKKFHFETKEVTVILTLFFVVSLLMFTAGIIIGKGLTNALHITSLNTSGNKTTVDVYQSTKEKIIDSIVGGEKKRLDYNDKPKEKETSKTVNLANPMEMIERDMKVESTESGKTGHTEVKNKPEQNAKVDLNKPAETAGKSSKEIPSSIETKTDVAKNDNAKKIIISENLESLFENSNKVVIKRNEEKTKEPEATRNIASVKPVEKIEPKKEKSEKVKPQVKVSPVKERFTIQVYSFNNEEDAKSKVLSLQSQGYKQVFYVETQIPGRGKWYRVGIGFYNNIDEAKVMAKKLKEKNTISSFVIRKIESDNSQRVPASSF